MNSSASHPASGNPSLTEGTDLNNKTNLKHETNLSKGSNLNRLLVAIAGAPGAGKSTLAEALCRDLNSQLRNAAGGIQQRNATSTVILPMDGFHFDNAVIEPLGLLPRKGSPATFDVSGFARLLKRIRKLPCRSYEPFDSDASAELARVDETAVDGIAIPVFDRELDLARAGASVIEQTHGIVLVEGNYLLLQRTPWSQLKEFFDLTVFIQVPVEVLEQRLVKRWLDHGHSDTQARIRAEGNDLPNARVVVEHSAEADLLVSSH